MKKVSVTSTIMPNRYRKSYKKKPSEFWKFSEELYVAYKNLKKSKEIPKGFFKHLRNGRYS